MVKSKTRGDSRGINRETTRIGNEAAWICIIHARPKVFVF